MKLHGMVCGLSAILLLAGCGSQTPAAQTVTAAASSAVTSAPSEPPRSTATGEWDQTWLTPYGNTYCADWEAVMTDREKRVASADFLVGGWKLAGETNVQIPGEHLLAQFTDQITTQCASLKDRTKAISEVAAAVFQAGRIMGDF